MNKFKIIISIVFLAIFLTYPVNVLAAVPDYSTNVDSLVDYIEANQDTSGKITGFGGETSWTIMGLVAAGIDPATMENGGNSPLDFLVANPPADTSTTAWERDLLAITAAGENPFTFGGRSYVAKVESFANAGQIGSTAALNDDIFGILSLVSAGQSADQQIISDSIDFLIANQNGDGGWSWSVGSVSDSNDTAVAVQALKAATEAGFSNSGMVDAIDTAVSYLLSLQQADGGWEYQPGFGTDGASTAWVIQAVVGEDTAVTDGLNFLASLQDASGGVQYQAGFGADTFTSGYALSAFAQKPFPIGIFEGQIEDPSDDPQDQDNEDSKDTTQPTNDDDGDVLSASDTKDDGQVLAEALPDTGINASLSEIDSASGDSVTNTGRDQSMLLLVGFGLSFILLGLVIRYTVVRIK